MVTINGGINETNYGFNAKPIEMVESSHLNEELLSDFHQIRYIRFHQNDAAFKVNSMDWNPSGTHLMVGSDDSVVRIFNLNGDGIDIFSKKHGCDVVRFCNQTNTAIFASRNETKIGADIHKIRHLDINSKAFLHYYAGHERQVTSISVNRCHNCFLSSSQDQTIRLWDCRLNAAIKPGDRCSLAVLKTSGRSVAAFDPLGVIFGVYQQNDSSMRLYDMRNYSKGPFKVAKLGANPSIGKVHSIEFSPNGRRIALSTDGSAMKVLDAYSLLEVSTPNPVKNDLNRELHLSWSPDSQFLFCGSSMSFGSPGNVGLLNWFNAETGELVKQWQTMHESFTQIVRFNPCHYLIASACHDVAYWAPSLETVTNVMDN